MLARWLFPIRRRRNRRGISIIVELFNVSLSVIRSIAFSSVIARFLEATIFGCGFSCYVHTLMWSSSLRFHARTWMNVYANINGDSLCQVCATAQMFCIALILDDPSVFCSSTLETNNEPWKNVNCGYSRCMVAYIRLSGRL